MRFSSSTSAFGLASCYILLAAIRHAHRPSRPSSSDQSLNTMLLYRLPFFSASFITFFTIFCSSIKKARTTRSLTQLAHREPP